MTARSITPARPRASRSRLRSLPRRLAAGLVGLALLVGLPVALIVLVGDPLADFPRSGAEVSDYIDRRYLPAGVLIGVLALVLWLVWLQYAWAVLWELAVVGPTAARGGLARSAPFAPRIVRSVASTVVSGMLAASVVAGSSSLAAVGTHLVSSATALATESPATPDPAPAASAAASLSGHRVHVVGQRESLWSISGHNDAMVRQLLALNENQIRSPIDVRPGMELIIPAALAPDDAGPPVPARPAAAVVAPDAPGADHHLVVTGDNLWEISETRLEVANGADPTNQEIADAVAEVVEANRTVVEDPDLIYPGEVLDLPADLSWAPPTVPAAPVEEGGPVRVGTGPSLGQAGSVVVPAEETRPVASADGTADPGEQAGAPLPVAALIGGVVPATGLLLFLLELVRKRRASFGAASARTAVDRDDGRLLRELAGASDHELVLWAAHQLHGLAGGPAPASPVPPVAVLLASGGLLSGDGGLTVLWTTPPPTMAPGWDPVADGRWLKVFDESATPRGGPVPAAIPGLLTLGELAGGPDAGQQLLVDLEAYGSLALSGAEERIEAVARSIVLEAGSGETLSNLIVTTVGFTAEGAGAMERVAGRSEDDALARAEAVVAQHRESTDPARGGRDIELFVVRTVEADTDRWLDVARPRSGVAVLLVGDMRSSRLGARLSIEANGVGTFAPLGLTLHPTGILPRTGEELGALFDQLLAVPGELGARPAASPALVAEGWAGASGDLTGDLTGDLNGDPTGDPANGAAGAPTRPPDGGTVTIRILGPSRCEELPGLAGRVLSLVTFLALQPNQVASRQAVIDAVWGTQGVSDSQFARVVAVARSHLGPIRFPRPASDDGVLRLEHVDTDLAQLRRLARTAGATGRAGSGPLWVEALDLITGPPFSGVALGWAAGSRIVDHACELVEAVIIEAIEVLVDVGDVASAYRAAQIGLVALPANEPIYRSYMRMAARLDQFSLVRSIYDHLCQMLSLLHPTENREPSPETKRLVRDLAVRLQPGVARESTAPGDRRPVPDQVPG